MWGWSDGGNAGDRQTALIQLYVDLVGLSEDDAKQAVLGMMSTDFTRGVIAILQAIGDDTAQKLPDEQILPYLLKTLEQRPYWLQFDSLEYLLHQTGDGSYGFADAIWGEFFGNCLNSPRSQCRLALTSQALLANLVDQIYRYDGLWHEYPLRGLKSAHWLDLFRNYGITPSTDTERDQQWARSPTATNLSPLLGRLATGRVKALRW